MLWWERTAENNILDAVVLFKVSIYELQYIILVNLLLNETLGVRFAQVLFHVATAMDAISLKDIKGNACVLLK